MKNEEQFVYSRPEQRTIIVEAPGIFPNVWVVYNYVGKPLGISYGAIWNIARADGIKLVRFESRWLLKREVPKLKTKRKHSLTNSQIVIEGYKMIFLYPFTLLSG
jgi:hypothetical protein